MWPGSTPRLTGHFVRQLKYFTRFLSVIRAMRISANPPSLSLRISVRNLNFTSARANGNADAADGSGRRTPARRVHDEELFREAGGKSDENSGARIRAHSVWQIGGGPGMCGPARVTAIKLCHVDRQFSPSTPPLASRTRQTYRSSQQGCPRMWASTRCCRWW